MASTWNTEYYDIMSFFYWEPQHLGKKGYPESKYQSVKEVMDHLKAMEVSLNHQFNLFFRLLPESLYLHFFRSVISGLVEENYHYQSCEEVEGLGLNDATQPDMLFVGSKSIIGVELKIRAKTTVEQVLKYAMLFYFEQRHSGLAKECNLIFFAPGTFGELFREPVVSIEALKSSFSVDMLPNTTRKGGINLMAHKETIVELARSMRIGFVSYSEVYTRLNDLKLGIDKLSPYSDAPLKLIDGMLNELEMRGLHACSKMEPPL
ncbi:MAG: hypothetical protein KME43_16165 [Myxacorys chilensis ATA2-1-KO14]|nr:hypothetical protein [Myxacorys chilensis ATA2-1-KO14]